MEKFKNVVKAFAKDDSGAAMVEYAVVLVVVTLVGGAVLVTLGANIDEGFRAVRGMLCNTGAFACTTALPT